jgi:uncharacterized protein YdeI (YjbR/CyaY-like superfamily)
MAFSHRKEYIFWIGHAKRAETRQARIEKTVQKLMAGRRLHDR